MKLHLHKFKRARIVPALLAGVIASSANAAQEVPATYSEPAWLGPLPSELRKQESDLYRWLLEQRAPIEKSGARAFTIHLSPQDLADIGQARGHGKAFQAEPLRYRVGVVKPVNKVIDFGALAGTETGSVVEQFGAMRITENGFVWTAIAQSQGASALRLRFSDFDLPAGAALYLYNERGQATGPYTGKGPNGNGEFLSHTVYGPKLSLQFHYNGVVTSAALKELDFELAAIAHIGPRFILPKYLKANPRGKAFCSFNASCVENASCFDTSDWGAINDARGGVAQILFQSGAFMFICSGGLLNDTDPSGQIPYFLTANHCLSTETEANSLEAFFQFDTPCGGDCYDPDGNVPSTLGSDLVATNSSSDYTLLELDQQPPVGSVLLGWTAQAVAFNDGMNLYRISHPQGAPQAFSQHDVDTSKGTCTVWPRGDWIYSTDVIGATEGGSSGSPVMNVQGQVVGQLSGACGTNVEDNCDSVNNATVDGALAAYFDEVDQFLNPGDGGGGGDTAVHVASINLGTQCAFFCFLTRGVADVTVVDADGNAVGGATVSGTFTGDVSGSDSDATNGAGLARLLSAYVWGSANNYQFCVDSISGSGITYDSGANAETCDSF